MALKKYSLVSKVSLVPAIQSKSEDPKSPNKMKVMFSIDGQKFQFDVYKRAHDGICNSSNYPNLYISIVYLCSYNNAFIS